MTVSLHRHFVEQVRNLPPAIRAAVFEAILALPGTFRRPAMHSGLGLRNLHPTGIWEARVGLDLRILFQMAPDAAILRFLGNHDDIRKYLRNL